MVVVIVLGVLASVAIPAFVKYIRRARTSEATEKVSLIFRGSVTYFYNVNTSVKRGVDGTAMQLVFPVSQAPTPATSCCGNPDGMCLESANVWDTPTWVALDFGMIDPHRYRYSYAAEGEGQGANFTSRANGDLDCDGVESIFERAGIVSPTLEVRGARGIYQYQAIE